MAGIRSYTRHVRALSNKPLVKIVGICLFISLALRWFIQHTRDDALMRLPPAPRPTARVDKAGIDWSKKYYVQIVTTPEYLCNALMVWAQIEEIGSRAQRMLLYPSHWDNTEIDSSDPTPIARLLLQAQKSYFVKLRPVPVLHFDHPAQATWTDTYTKLLAFNLTDFERVLYLSSDANVLGNLDELFLLPRAAVAMPYIYYTPPTGWAYSSNMLLVTPSASEFQKVQTAVLNAAPEQNDLDILNSLYSSHIQRIPQRPWSLLSTEFRHEEHVAYLQSRSAKWDPDKELGRAKFMSFSDSPIPKPWMKAKKEELNRWMPRCGKGKFGASDCRNREIWLGLYSNYEERRKAICGVDFEVMSPELQADNIDRFGKTLSRNDE